MFKKDASIITRFAPSPSGRLHLGHAYSALFSASKALDVGGKFLLRIEDLDLGRCRPEFEAGIFEDLKWLGLTWEEDVLRQSDRFDVYDSFLHVLEEGGVTYPCFCTRRDIMAEIENAPRAPHGPDGALYPGICKYLTKDEIDTLKSEGRPFATRLHMDKAIRMTGPLTFMDQEVGLVSVDGSSCGDVVLARKDVPTSYHLSVVVDDALQGVNLVTRGVDLLHATHIHRILQTLLGLAAPSYYHHPLLTDDAGKRYAKRDKALTLQSLRNAGKAPADIKKMVGFAN